MRTHLSKLSVLLFLLFLASCSLFDSSALRVTSELPHGVVQASGVLQFEFSRSVVLPESTNIGSRLHLLNLRRTLKGNLVCRIVEACVQSRRTFGRRYKIQRKTEYRSIKETIARALVKGDEEFSFFDGTVHNERGRFSTIGSIITDGRREGQPRIFVHGETGRCREVPQTGKLTACSIRIQDRGRQRRQK